MSEKTQEQQEQQEQPKLSKRGVPIPEYQPTWLDDPIMLLLRRPQRVTEGEASADEQRPAERICSVTAWRIGRTEAE